MDKSDNSSNLVKIASVLGGILLVVCVVFIIFAREQIGALVAIAWAYVVLALGFGILQYKTDKNASLKKR